MSRVLKRNRLRTRGAPLCALAGARRSRCRTGTAREQKYDWRFGRHRSGARPLAEEVGAVLGEPCLDEGAIQAWQGRIIQAELAILEPGADGHAKSLLLPIKHVRGKDGLQRLFQYILCLAMPVFPCGRDSACEIDKINIEERSAYLQAMHHARPVDFDEDVILEVELGEVLQRPVDDIGLRAAFPDCDGLREDLLQVGGLAEKIAKLRGVE